MTNELTLSKSKINTFIECPRKFKYRYIDEITEEANEYMLLGTEVHEIAEEIAG
ncbi:MAG: PD-(D/E)XK nuclease family protein [Methanobrevibacter ruminantium]|uniref:PD-(D/E)XK nuclease family protein n=1 Tax=Methanobrevibacter ruminantium TaxID=83816 RepID=UPI0026EB34F9|nr:PD-(D/E)XK nuclease family protein [Methanobrevibacter ruminantium]MCI5737812.1 PD-(D/E)XK nuclease family protein [Methanobrevibacter ruminantium]MDD6048145.1 PD-(D/E)XK nuclease family protein [Methanobrevibacter ruminantium]MDO5843238.1 PD-(D/E)XK nuclease family protein [Methanobrevibacter ruminantium]